jgi:hypothetical protein
VRHGAAGIVPATEGSDRVDEVPNAGLRRITGAVCARSQSGSGVGPDRVGMTAPAAIGAPERRVARAASGSVALADQRRRVEFASPASGRLAKLPFLKRIGIPIPCPSGRGQRGSPALSATRAPVYARPTTWEPPTKMWGSPAT